MSTHTRLLRNGALTTAATMALLFTTGTAAIAGNGGQGGTAAITVDHDCSSVDVTSSKDISNIVLRFADGDTQKLDGLSGRSGTFQGTGDNAGETITTVWVKSGNNASGDGPGYGEKFDVSDADCDDDTTTGSETSTDSENKAGGDKKAGSGKKTGSENQAGSGTKGQGSTAAITVDHDCSSVDVTSSKDISNIVLRFADGDTQKLDGLSGRSGTFQGTGDNAGETITTVWVKSGNNASGDGPGYGEKFDVSDADCDDDTTTTGNETSNDGNTDGGEGTEGGNTDGGNTDGENTGAENTGGEDTDGEDTDSTNGTNDGDQVLGSTLDGTTGTSDQDGAPGDDEADGTQEARVLGATLERVVSADATDVRAATGPLPMTGAAALTALLAALGALGLGAALVRRDRASA